MNRWMEHFRDMYCNNSSTKEETDNRNRHSKAKMRKMGEIME